MATIPFNLYDALNGALVTVAGHEDECTGRLVKEGSGATQYVAYLGGSKMIVDKDGTVRVCTPSLSYVTVNSTVLRIYSDSLDDDLRFKTRGESQHQETGYSDEVNLTNIQLRDYFALTALRVIMERVDHPESADDAKIMHYSKVAYRWAQGMMSAALASRQGVEESSGSTPTQESDLVDVTTDTLATTTEKLLYNIATTLENMKLQNKDNFDNTHTEDYELLVKVPEVTEIGKLTELTEIVNMPSENSNNS